METLESNENLMHPELNNPKIEPIEGISELLKQANENHENPITAPVPTAGLATPEAINAASKGASELGPVSPEKIDELHARIASLGLATPEAIIKASNGTSELGPVSLDKVNAVANAAVEQAAISIEAQGRMKAIALKAEATNEGFKKLGDVPQQVENVYNTVMGWTNRGVVACYERRAGKFV